jgi:ATP-dependent DNA ligase
MLWRISRRDPPAGFIQPSRPTLVAAPPAGPGWLHEMKLGGFRILTQKRGELVEVWSRRGALFNYRFPRIAKAVGALPVDNAMIDGEAVVFRSDGHSDFAALRTRAGGEQASFVAFDLLGLEANDLRERPLEERREALRGWLLEPTIFGSARRLRLRGCSCSPRRSSWASRASCRSAPAAAIPTARPATGLSA